MKKLFVIFLSVFLIVTFFFSPSFSAIQPQEHNKATKLKVMNSYGSIPLSFIQNTGQLNRTISYYLKGERGTIYFTGEGIAYNLLSGKASSSSRKSRLNYFKRLSFTLKPVGASKKSRLFSRNKLPGKVNHFIGNNPKNWRTDIPTYKEIVYKDIYNGIDMKIYGNRNRMEYDFIVSPGADPSDITLSFDGINALNVDKDGNLLIMTPLGELKHMKPLSYQEIDGRRHIVTCHYVISKNNFSFCIGDYDKRYSLVIDPLTSSYSTYLGGSSSDYARSIAIDASGNAYITGSTNSDDFPTENGYQETTSGVFVTKLNPNGDTLIYSTYLGGSGMDFSYDIAVDASGSAYVVGWAYSDDFPIKNAFQETRHGQNDAFVAKLSPSGNDLSFSTYLGGNETDIGKSIDVDSSGCAYVTGETFSSDFPVHHALQEIFGEGFNTFVTKLNQGGDTIAYSTYIGGSLNHGNSIAVDSSGSAYVTGHAYDEFPTKNAYQATYGGGVGDAFVFKLNPSGDNLSYSTYLGGSSDEEASDIAVDASGSAYVTGGTDSNDFPTQNAYQATIGGGTGATFYYIDAFATKLSPGGNNLLYSTYLGGNDKENGNAIAIDASGCAHITGYTYSSNFPVKGECQGTLRGYSDAFYTKLNSNGDTLASSTYLGGNSWDEGSGIAVDASGNAYITGETDSENFPTKNAFQGMSGGGRDAFISKLTEREKQVLYVDSDVNNSGDGLTWSEAFKTIQDAMDAASGGDEIWVKKGTYLLSTQINVDKAVGIYGGFSGGETKRDDRNPSTNVTKIDGKSSVYHCFYITADATIDGLFITGGKADGDWPDNLGGGIINTNSSPFIKNCTVSENSAYFGGAVFNDESSPTITNCTFSANSATTSGGSIYNDQSSPAINNCIISENSAAFGGGLYNQKSSPTITNCTISGNNATSGGGGIRNKESSSPAITNSIFWNNTAPDGLEIYNDESSSPAVTYCDIQGGYSGEGNITSDPRFVDHVNNDLHLQANSPCIDKGDNNALGIPTIDFEGDPRIADGDNDGTATVDIGADEYAFIDTDSDGLPDDWEISYFGDLGQGSGGDYDGDELTNLEEYQTGTNPTNALPKADAGADQKVDEGVTVTLNASSSSDPDGTISSYLWTQTSGMAVTLSDETVATPTFTAPNVDPAGETLTFQVTVTDNDGEQAADTCTTNITWINLPQYVDGDIAGSGGGTSWDRAFRTIQEAVNAAGEGDEIWLKKGTYNLSSPINVSKAVGIYGGFNGTETKRDQRDWKTNVTTIDGQGSVYHCFSITSDATIDGLVVTGGNAYGDSPNYRGGGIYVSQSSPRITNCNISENAADYGGGIYNLNASPTITTCSFTKNNTVKSGGGIYNNQSSPTITNCSFSSNSASSGGSIVNAHSSSPAITGCTFTENSAEWGGAIYNDMSSPPITTCSFSENSATTSGGSIYNDQSSPTINNCTISINDAPYGAGIYNYDSSSPTITNCTLSGNSATVSGGAIRNRESSAPTITNCILWGDTAPDGPEIYNDDTSNPTVTYCDIQGGYSGEGNITSDPRFVDHVNNDLHLQTNSPCIDKGNNSAQEIPSNDFEGEARIDDGNNDGTATVDIGADEYTDTDSDGMPDYWEKSYFGDLSQGPNGDYDGDGLTNLEEYQAGTDPASKADGDVAPLGNRDGIVNVGDALVALRFALTLETPTQEDIAHGDVAPLDASGQPSPDGVINVGDALVILRKALRIIEF